MGKLSLTRWHSRPGQVVVPPVCELLNDASEQCSVQISCLTSQKKFIRWLRSPNSLFGANMLMISWPFFKFPVTNTKNSKQRSATGHRERYVLSKCSLPGLFWVDISTTRLSQFSYEEMQRNAISNYCLIKIECVTLVHVMRCHNRIQFPNELFCLL